MSNPLDNPVNDLRLYSETEIERMKDNLKKKKSVLSSGLNLIDALTKMRWFDKNDLAVFNITRSGGYDFKIKIQAIKRPDNKK